jgi:hypothetical protein
MKSYQEKSMAAISIRKKKEQKNSGQVLGIGDQTCPL